MDERFEITVKENHVYVRFLPKKAVTHESIIDAIRAEAEAAGSNQINDIWDFRGCRPDPSLTFDTILKVVEYLRANRDPNLDRSKTAMLADTDVGYGLSRMYETLAGDLPYEVDVFDDLEKAEEWVRAKASGPGGV